MGTNHNPTKENPNYSPQIAGRAFPDDKSLGRNYVILVASESDMDKHLPDTIGDETLQMVPERIVRLFSVLPLTFDASSVTLCCPDEPDYVINK